MTSPPVPLSAMRRGGTPRRRLCVHRMERCRTDPPGVSSNQRGPGCLFAKHPLAPWPRPPPGSKMGGTCGQELSVADPFPQLRAALAGQYTIERELGRGGMATVYLAHDRKHGRPVAIKVLAPELAAAVGRERFLREIETAARLTHPHILPLHDSGEADGLLYYVMPYVEGQTLRGASIASGRSRSRMRCRSPARWRTLSATPTNTRWCTGTSSLRTSCSRLATRS